MNRVLSFGSVTILAIPVLVTSLQSKMNILHCKYRLIRYGAHSIMQNVYSQLTSTLLNCLQCAPTAIKSSSLTAALEERSKASRFVSCAIWRREPE